MKMKRYDRKKKPNFDFFKKIRKKAKEKTVSGIIKLPPRIFLE